MECGMNDGSGLLEFGVGGDVPDESDIGLGVVGFHTEIELFK